MYSEICGDEMSIGVHAVYISFCEGRQGFSSASGASGASGSWGALLETGMMEG